MTELYDLQTLERLSGVGKEELLYWTRSGVIKPKKVEGERFFYDFKALVAVRVLRDLREKGVSVRGIREAVRRLRRLFPRVEQPLAEVKVTLWGRRLIFQYDEKKFDTRGQLFLDFSPQGPSKTLTLPQRANEGLFFRALQAEEEGNLQEAYNLYRKLVELDPTYADALVNLGNLELQRGNPKEAEHLYRRSLEIDPDHVEANYNLACLLEDQGRWEDALLFYRKALHEDPDFADAHFNIARLLQTLGRTEEAKPHWRRYLELDPESPWAEWARRFL